MKTLLTILLFLFPFIIIAQNPTIYFDKTRCQKARTMELVDTLPYSFSLVPHLQKIIPKRHLSRPTKFSLWKLNRKTYNKIQEDYIHKNCFVKTKGKYLLQIHDRIHLTFIEMELKEGQLKCSIYSNCVIHD